MRTPFVLSHHPPQAYHRCVSVGGLHLCTRCLGLYPMMFAAIGAQIAWHAPLHSAFDPWVAYLLPVPALIDWGRGRFAPSTGTHASRLATGALLGLSLGRTLYLHLNKPGFLLTMTQIAGLAVVFLAVETAARLRRTPTDRNDPRAVSQEDRSDPTN